ncbi:hypothetical protein CYMTET_54791, partial [Cymbomonas tetramitiformis]
LDFWSLRISSIYPIYVLGVLTSFPMCAVWSAQYNFNSIGSYIGIITSHLLMVEVFWWPFNQINYPFWFICVYMYCIWLLPLFVKVAAACRESTSGSAVMLLLFLVLSLVVKELFSFLQPVGSKYGHSELHSAAGEYDGWLTGQPTVEFHVVASCEHRVDVAYIPMTQLFILLRMHPFFLGSLLYMFYEASRKTAVLEHQMWGYLTDVMSMYYVVLTFVLQPENKAKAVFAWAGDGLGFNEIPALLYIYCLALAPPRSLTVYVLSSQPLQILGSLILFIYIFHFQIINYLLLIKHGDWSFTSTQSAGVHTPMSCADQLLVVVLATFIAFVFQNYVQPAIVQDCQRLAAWIWPTRQDGSTAADSDSELDVADVVLRVLHDVTGRKLKLTSKLATILADSFGLVSLVNKVNQSLGTSLAPASLFSLAHGQVKDFVAMLEEKVPKADRRSVGPPGRDPSMEDAVANRYVAVPGQTASLETQTQVPWRGRERLVAALLICALLSVPVLMVIIYPQSETPPKCIEEGAYHCERGSVCRDLCGLTEEQCPGIGESSVRAMGATEYYEILFSTFFVILGGVLILRHGCIPMMDTSDAYNCDSVSRRDTLGNGGAQMGSYGSIL